MDDANEYVARPTHPTGTGVLVLHGSSGRLESARAELLAQQGCLALAITWFGSIGQQPGPWEVPVETFTRAVDRLVGECDRVVVLGLSFGAEAALVTGSLDSRIDGVAALAPSSVVWAGVTELGVQTSHWTWQGQPLPFVPFLEDWEPTTQPPAFKGLYEASLAAAPDRAQEAEIAVERIPEVLLVVGGEDQVWPSSTFARSIVARRKTHGMDTTLVEHAQAGHRVVLPGEIPATGGMSMARGGTPEADAELGQAAWPHLLRLLHGQ